MWEYNDELYHFGVKGMKWGVRRYGSSSGSLIPAGKKRYDDSSPKSNVKTKSKPLKGKKLKKAQDDWDKNYMKKYNEAADIANRELVPKINKKYEKYDFSDSALKNPKTKATYDKYVNEYETEWNNLLNTKIKDLGKRPK